MVELYEQACGKLKELGYRRDTIYDFALPGHRNRYRERLLAFTGSDRLGFGYEADSFLNGLYYTNGHGLNEYVSHPTELEIIANHVSKQSIADMALRFTLCQLEGCGLMDAKALRFAFGEPAQHLACEVLPTLLEEGCLREQGSDLQLTSKGIVTGALYRMG